MPWYLLFWMLSLKPAFSLSSFTLINRLFSFSLLYAIRVVSSAYLKLLMFLPANWIPVCKSSSPAFFMIHSAKKLNKQSDNIQVRCTPFPILNQLLVPCQVLIVASWPAHRLLRRQARWLGIPISLRIFQFVVIHTYVWTWELHYKESWAPKNWCFWTVVLEKTLESPLDCKEIQLIS